MHPPVTVKMSDIEPSYLYGSELDCELVISVGIHLDSDPPGDGTDGGDDIVPHDGDAMSTEFNLDNYVDVSSYTEHDIDVWLENIAQSSGKCHCEGLNLSKEANERHVVSVGSYFPANTPSPPLRVPTLPSIPNSPTHWESSWDTSHHLPLNDVPSEMAGTEDILESNTAPCHLPTVPVDVELALEIEESDAYTSDEFVDNSSLSSADFELDKDEAHRKKKRRNPTNIKEGLPPDVSIAGSTLVAVHAGQPVSSGSRLNMILAFIDREGSDLTSIDGDEIVDDGGLDGGIDQSTHQLENIPVLTSCVHHSGTY